MRRTGGGPNAVTAAACLAAEIETVRRTGIALGDEQFAEGARSIAAPITRWLDKPILAVEITAPASTYAMEEMFVHFGPLVRHAAQLLSV
jgi:DNA-binding IclR family transcriptional regulator